MSFGPHIMLDLNDCDPEKLDSLELCYKFLDEFPAQIAMTKITQPHVFRYAGKAPQDRGITGVVIIAESHISLHTFPLRSFAFIDIFSCKPFDTVLARDFCTTLFDAKDPECIVVRRGAKFHSRATKIDQQKVMIS